jgi:branched-chain amino acid transport system substrate-binding protein
MRRIVLAGLLSASALWPLAMPAAAAEINVGVILALTGDYGYSGVTEREGMEIAMAEIEADEPLGTDKLKLLIEDDASDKSQVINLLNRFALRDKVPIILGPTSSFEGVVAAPIANNLKVPLLTVSATSPVMTTSGEWGFKAVANAVDIIPAVATYAATKMKVKTVVTVHARNNDGQTVQKDVGVKTFKEHGVTVLSEESVLRSDTDFQSIVTKIASLKPEAIYTTLVGPQAAGFVIQARQAGIPANVPVLGAPPLGSDQYIEIGGAAIEGSVFAADYFPGSQRPVNQRFVTAYKAKFNRLPDNWAALGYSSVKLAVEALRTAGYNPSRDAIRTALAKIRDFDVPLGTGRFSFDEGRNAQYGALVLTIKGGKIIEAP